MTVNKNNLYKAIRAALEGPEARDLRIKDYRFNVKPAAVIRNGNTFIVKSGNSGYISRRRRGRPNDRIYYEVEKTEERLQDIKVEIDRGGFKSVGSRLRDRLMREIPQIPIPPPFPQDPFGREPTRRLTSLEKVLDDDIQKLLDGSWEGEAAYLIAAIGLWAGERLPDSSIRSPGSGSQHLIPEGVQQKR